MLSLAPGYARLDIEKDDDFSEVSESIRALLHVCRLNRLDAALVVSRQGALDWRSSLRIGIRFSASRGALPDIRLALVAGHDDPRVHADVREVAEEAGVKCRIFAAEEQALGWIADSGERPSR